MKTIKPEPINSRNPKQLFDLYYPRLCDFAYSFLHSVDEAEDVVQDAFVVFLEKKESINFHELAIKSFLYRTVRNISLNKIRHQKVRNRFDKNWEKGIIDDNHMLKAMVHAEVIGEIHQALTSLPPGCRLVVRLGYLEGLRNDQIATELGVSINTVKSQKKRALVLLKNILSPQAMVLLLFVLNQ